MPAEKKPAPKEVYINNDLPILYVDAINTRHRKDSFTYISFATNTPFRLVEQVRLMIDDDSLRLIIDDLCRVINYHPKKPTE